MNEIIVEYNSRFTLLAEEISNIKDTLLKLQSYTMSVNKTLMEERIHILSDLGTIVSDQNSEINNMIIENTTNNGYDIEYNNKNDNNIEDDNITINQQEDTKINQQEDTISTNENTYVFSNNLDNNTSEVKNENTNIKINNITGTNFRRNRNK